MILPPTVSVPCYIFILLLQLYLLSSKKLKLYFKTGYSRHLFIFFVSSKHVTFTKFFETRFKPISSNLSSNRFANRAQLHFVFLIWRLNHIATVYLFSQSAKQSRYELSLFDLRETAATSVLLSLWPISLILYLHFTLKILIWIFQTYKKL